MTWTDPQLLAWMAVLVVSAWLPPQRFQASTVSAVGLAFLAWTDPMSLVALGALGSLAFVLSRGASGQAWRVIAVILVTAGAVVFFKIGVRLGDGAARVYVPLGLSYYGLRIIHTSLESYKGQPRPAVGVS